MENVVSIPVRGFDLLTDKSKWPAVIKDIKFEEGFNPEAAVAKLQAVVLFYNGMEYYPMAIYKDVSSSMTFFVNEKDKDRGHFSYSNRFMELMRRLPAHMFDKVICYRLYGNKLYSHFLDRLK